MHLTYETVTETAGSYPSWPISIAFLFILFCYKMKSPGIDYQILPNRPTPEEMIEIINMGNKQQIEGMFNDIQENIRLTSAYWLKDDSDFVGFEGTIQSPWCEHLMQRFSNAFIRIGIIDPTPEDYKAVIARCYKEVTEQ